MKLPALLLAICLNNILLAQKQWPVLKHYEDRFIEKIAMPVGGIGTGNISIGGNGQWKDVEIMNKPGMGFYGSGYAKTSALLYGVHRNIGR